LIINSLLRFVVLRIVNYLLYYAKDNKKVLFLRGIDSGNMIAIEEIFIIFERYFLMKSLLEEK